MYIYGYDFDCNSDIAAFIAAYVTSLKNNNACVIYPCSAGVCGDFPFPRGYGTVKYYDEIMYNPFYGYD